MGSARRFEKEPSVRGRQVERECLSSPLSSSSEPGGLRQDPGVAVESPALGEARRSLENTQGGKRMARYVLRFEEIDQTQGTVVGGKGANLGELSRIDGVSVPPGFCVTTNAFDRIRAEVSPIDNQLDQLSRLEPDDRQAIRALSARVRGAIEGIAIPGDVAKEIADSLTRLGAQHAYAVRSSATAEDLPTASFAGQQDTYLNIVGPAAILAHVSRCTAGWRDQVSASMPK